MRNCQPVGLAEMSENPQRRNGEVAAVAKTSTTSNGIEGYIAGSFGTMPGAVWKCWWVSHAEPIGCPTYTESYFQMLMAEMETLQKHTWVNPFRQGKAIGGWSKCVVVYIFRSLARPMQVLGIRARLQTRRSV